MLTDIASIVQGIGLILTAAGVLYGLMLSRGNGTAIAKVEAKTDAVTAKVDVLHETVNGRLTQLIAANAATSVAQVAAARSEGQAQGRKTEEDRASKP